MTRFLPQAYDAFNGMRCSLLCLLRLAHATFRRLRHTCPGVDWWRRRPVRLAQRPQHQVPSCRPRSRRLRQPPGRNATRKERL